MAIIAVVIIATGSVQGWEDNSNSNGSSFKMWAPEACCKDSCGCGRFFLEGDLLYLRAYEGNLVSACDSTHITDTTEGSIIVSRLDGKAHDPDFRWNAGFRIAAGYDFGGSQSGIRAYWTHFNSDAHRHKNHTDKVHWKVDLDIVDLLYGFKLELSPGIVVIPFGGVRYANIDQKLHTHFTSTTTTLSGSSSSSSASIGSSSSSFSSRGSSSIGSSGDITEFTSTGHFKERFYGAGGVFGSEAELAIGCGFSLYGNLAFGVLYGKFHVRTNSIDEFDTGRNINHLKRRLDACQAVLDSIGGIRWQTCFCGDKRLIVQFGLEQHRFFNHNQICGYGDLCLEGASLGLGIEY